MIDLWGDMVIKICLFILHGGDFDFYLTHIRGLKYISSNEVIYYQSQSFVSCFDMYLSSNLSIDKRYMGSFSFEGFGRNFAYAYLPTYLGT